MASITRNHLYTVDLNKPLTRQSCGILLAEGDNNGDCFSFALVRDGVNAAVDSTAVVSAYMIRQDGSTVPVNGTYAGNTASVTLPKACYAQEGHFALAVKVDMSGATTTVAVLDGFIKNVTTDTVVDPGTVIPTLEDLLAQIERMETATEAANTAANNAKEFIVTVTVPEYIIAGGASGITADKTFAEIRAAITAGKTPVVKLVTEGKTTTEILHLYSFAPVAIIFRQHMGTAVSVKKNECHRLTFISTGSIELSSVNINSVPDVVEYGQVLVSDSVSYNWRAPEELPAIANLAPAIIPTATGEVVTVNDSANRPLAGLRLYGKTTQDGTPTPDSPVPLVNVGAGGSIGIKASSGNILKQYTGGDNAGITAEVLTDGYTRLYGTSTKAYYGDDGFRFSLIGEQTYTFSAEGVMPGTEDFCVYLWPDDTQVANTHCVLNKPGSITFSVPKTNTYRCMPMVQAGVTIDVRFRCTLTPGTDATAFEPYKDGGSVALSTPNGLPGIPVTSGGNYTDESGQQWVCDEVDFGRGVYVQRVGSIVFNGSQTWETLGSNGGGYLRFLYRLANKAHGISSNQKGNILCSALAAVSADETFLMSSDGSAVNTAGDIAVYCSAYAGDLDAWNSYLANTPMEVVYQLASPIETSLSASELSAFRIMTSQKPTTTVYNDAGAGMVVDYIADTKNYIDQRISALLNA